MHLKPYTHIFLNALGISHTLIHIYTHNGMEGMELKSMITQTSTTGLNKLTNKPLGLHEL